MDVSRVAPSSALDAAAGAWAQAAPPESLAGPADPSNAPARHVDHGAETGSAQNYARPQPTPGQAPPRADAALPAASHALSEFALPAAQLVPGALIGLQVEAAWARPLPKPADAAPGKPAPDEAPPPAPRRERAPDDDDDDDDDAGDDDDTAAPPGDEAPGDTVLDADDDAGRERLVRALQALFAGSPPLALRAAAEQWQRGRCVVLACPHGVDPDGPARAFVLRPPRGACRRPGSAAAPLRLVGLAVDARLQWTSAPVGARWCHARMVKEHQPRSGRQLVPIDSAAPCPCDVQLGPVLAHRRRPCEVHLRIDAVRRFWTALGDQWSVHVLVCSVPLAGAARTMEEPSC